MAFILCVDDDASIRFLLQKVLSDAGHDVSAAKSGEAALQLIAERTPELLVLDLEMPGMSGFEVCRHVKANPFTSRIPVLMVTAQSDIERKIEGFEVGADDYLGKPFHPRELTVRAASLLRLVQREGDRNPSSGLPGTGAIARAIEARRGQNFSILYLDLDHFKPFADHFGFATADKVIQDTGRLVADAVTKHGSAHDLAGHIGGDDFLVVTNPVRAQKIAQMCIENFESVVHRHVDDEAKRTGIFAGRDREGKVREWPLAKLTATIVEIAPEDDFSIHHLGTFAAEAKRVAKGEGRTLQHAMLQSFGKTVW